MPRVRGVTVALCFALAALTAGCVSAPNGGDASPENKTGDSAGAAAKPASADTHDHDLPSLVGPPDSLARDPSTAHGGDGMSLPAGWEPWILHPTKKKTQYRLERRDSGIAMRADADSSASGLLTNLRIDPARRPFLEWRWRVDSLIEGADNTDRHAEDSPVRIVLAFDGDKGKLPLRDRIFFENIKLFTGRDLPYATLMYIWENKLPAGSVIVNPHTERVRKIVVSSGTHDVQKWVSFRRNIVEDYKLVYGRAPGRLIGVAILTDTDNTKEKVTAWYGDIKLLRH